MAPTYKIYYFNGRARAELSRMVLGYAGIPFEDIRYEHGAEWEKAKAKENFPSNQIPCLEVDGKRLGQSMAMARFLARETGIAGKNSWEQAKIDSIVDSITDLLYKVWARQFYAKTEEAKAALSTEISETLAPRVFGNLDKCLEGTYFLGNEITLADLALVDACDTFEREKVCQFMAKFPRLVELHKRLIAEPKLAAYLAKRPASQW